MPHYSEAVIDEIKSKHNIVDIAARWTAKPPKRSGNAGEHLALCLFHNERTPSMRLNNATGEFHCFGCGHGGDILTLVMEYLGVDFVDAMKWLGAADLPEVDPAERRKAVEEDRRRVFVNLQDAIRFWAGARAIERGDPAWVYLRARGIDIDLPPSLRFGMVPRGKLKDAAGEPTDEWGPSYPALICAAQNGEGKVVGIQRVFFANNDPTLGKADCKLSLGQVRGAALRLAPPAAHINLTEGPEDGLSIMAMYPDRPTWVTLGTGMMPHVELPKLVEEITLLGQNDEAGRMAIYGKPAEGGREARPGAAHTLGERGLQLHAAFPPERVNDWNDLLRERLKNAVTG